MVFEDYVDVVFKLSQFLVQLSYGEQYHKSVINLLKSDKNLYYLFIETINHILNINMVNSFLPI